MKVSKLVITFAASITAMFSLSGLAAHAAQLLGNGGLEDGFGPQGWSVTESITGMPGAPVSAAEQAELADIAFANSPGSGLGFYLKPNAGNTGTYQDQNRAANVSLSQTVAVAPSKNFTFTGHSFLQIATSANVDTLFADSPSGSVPSPTVAAFTVDFLDSSHSLIVGASQTVNLPKNRATDASPNDWVASTIASVNSPTTAAYARVTASATNMVASCTTACPAGQNIYLDNFSLVQNGAGGGEKLVNGNLNALGAPVGFTVNKTIQNNISFSGDPSFAANSGAVGMWLQAFQGGDAEMVSNPTPAAPGGHYTFSAFSKWEAGYGSGNPFPPIGQARTSTFMTIDFLNSSNVIIGSQILDLCQDPGISGCTLQQNDSVWRQFTFTATAPAGTAFVEIEAGAKNMYNTGVNPQSAFFDDLSLTGPIVPEPASALLLSVASGLASVRFRRPRTR